MKHLKTFVGKLSPPVHQGDVINTGESFLVVLETPQHQDSTSRGFDISVKCYHVNFKRLLKYYGSDSPQKITQLNPDDAIKIINSISTFSRKNNNKYNNILFDEIYNEWLKNPQIKMWIETNKYNI